MSASPNCNKVTVEQWVSLYPSLRRKLSCKSGPPGEAMVSMYATHHLLEYKVWNSRNSSSTTYGLSRLRGLWQDSLAHLINLITQLLLRRPCATLDWPHLVCRSRFFFLSPRCDWIGNSIKSSLHSTAWRDPPICPLCWPRNSAPWSAQAWTNTHYPFVWPQNPSLLEIARHWPFVSSAQHWQDTFVWYLSEAFWSLRRRALPQSACVEGGQYSRHQKVRQPAQLGQFVCLQNMLENRTSRARQASGASSSSNLSSK